MNPPSGDSPWDKAVATARRRERGTVEVPPAELPPPGFAARLAARWAELKQNETFRLWCRWSVRAALVGLVLAGLAALVFPPRPAHDTSLRPPRVEVPSFSSP
jgi:hypothetical protein